MTPETLKAIPREELPRAAESLTGADIAWLVDMLDEKADATRYQALLLLTARSERAPDVFPHWPRFRAKLTDENSYQRSIGILLLSENARWDAQGAIEECLADCLQLAADEKPITARQAIGALGRIARDAPRTAGRIVPALTALDLSSIRETMRKLILMDACRALAAIRERPELKDEIDAFLLSALSGDVLDRAGKKELRALTGL